MRSLAAVTLHDRFERDVLLRKALAAVDRDKVVLGKPQVIRIEKN